MLRNKRGSEELATAMHLLLGVMLFTIVAVAVTFFFISEDITAVFMAGKVEADKIATRIVFSKNCLAYNDTYDAFDWYDLGDRRRSAEVVRAGVIDVRPSKFDATTIMDCVPYSLTNYSYKIKYEDIEGATTGILTPCSTMNLNCSKNSQVLINVTKVYPVMLYHPGWSELHNGVIEMEIAFCYINESVVDL